MKETRHFSIRLDLSLEGEDAVETLRDAIRDAGREQSRYAANSYDAASKPHHNHESWRSLIEDGDRDARNASALFRAAEAVKPADVLPCRSGPETNGELAEAAATSKASPAMQYVLNSIEGLASYAAQNRILFTATMNWVGAPSGTSYGVLKGSIKYADRPFAGWGVEFEKKFPTDPFAAGGSPWHELDGTRKKIRAEATE